MKIFGKMIYTYKEIKLPLMKLHHLGSTSWALFLINTLRVYNDTPHSWVNSLKAKYECLKSISF